MHIDLSKKETKYPVIAVTCDDGGPRKFSNAVLTPGTIAEQAFDVVHINTSSKIVTCTRFGGGEKNILTNEYSVNDRTFSYQ